MPAAGVAFHGPTPWRNAHGINVKQVPCSCGLNPGDVGFSGCETWLGCEIWNMRFGGLALRIQCGTLAALGHATVKTLHLHIEQV